MISYYKSTLQRPSIDKKKTLQPGSWLRCERPNDEDKAELDKRGVSVDVLTDALDPHEVPRIEQQGSQVYFITRLPDTDDEFNDYTTPILFVIDDEALITVSRDSLGRLWQPFIDNIPAPTTQRTKLFVLMMEAIVTQYQTRVASINRQMRAVTNDITTLRPNDISTLVEYERKLNDYLDALIPTNTAIEKLLGGRLLQMYKEDRDLVEDLSISLEQLMARCKSLLRTITNVRDSFRAVMDTRLNETIRLLTVITLALTVPTMLAGLYGMNVDLPGNESSPGLFWVIAAISILIGGLMSYYFLKKRA